MWIVGLCLVVFRLIVWLVWFWYCDCLLSACELLVCLVVSFSWVWVNLYVPLCRLRLFVACQLGLQLITCICSLVCWVLCG